MAQTIPPPVRFAKGNSGRIDGDAFVSSAAGRGLPALPNLVYDFPAGQVQNLSLASAAMQSNQTAPQNKSFSASTCALLTALVLGILVGCSKPAVIGNDAGLQSRLDSYFGALLAGRHRVTIDMMDTRFFSSREAREEAVTQLETSTTTFTYYAITNGQPFGHFKGSNSLHCFVPYISDAEIRGQRATVKSYLLATCYNGSDEWLFVDIGTKERDLLARYYDHLPNELPKASLEKK